MIRYRLWVWVLCLVFPTWVWAENETRTCTSFTQQGRQVTFHLADSAALQLQLCSSSVVKIWFSPDGQLQRRNASFAVINEELEEVGTIHVDEQAACYEIFTPKLSIRVNKSPMSLQIFDKYQKLLFSDYADKGHVSEGTKKVEYKVLRRDEHFFGLGEKAGKMDRRGESYKMWNSDKPCYSVVEDPLYKSIPFFMSNRGYGMFMHTSAPVTCDFGATYIGLNKMFMGDENLDLFVFFGEPKDILDEYTDLVGKPGMPPLWSFGTWMSRITYFSEKEGYDVAANIRKNKYPCDVIHFDTGWFDVDWQCDYKFSENRFQNPQQMLKDLKSQGFHVCLWQLPYFTPKNRYFPELIKKDMYVKNGNGELPYEDVVLDFSNPETVKWYQDKLAGLLNIGVSAIKVDFGEAAPLNGIYASGKSGWYEHNLYPVRYDMAVSEITKKLHNENIMWARAAWAGSQRYPLHWGGDAATTNTGMLGTLRAGLSFGLSGFSFWSHDMGGFVKSTPEDLYCRWLPFGFLTSHTRAHGAPPTEPWLYDSKRVQDVFRKSAEMKYRLMPYVYAQAKECTEKGLPMLRALFVEFPDDPGAWKVDDEYLFGSQILVAPLLESGITGRTVYLPEGKWIDYQTEKVYEGGWHRIEAGSLPIIMLVRDGSVLPHLKLAQSTSEMDWSKMSLKVYSADKKQAEGLICLPTDNRIQVVKVDCAKAKPQLLNQVEGTSLSF